MLYTTGFTGGDEEGDNASKTPSRKNNAISVG